MSDGGAQSAEESTSRDCEGSDGGSSSSSSYCCDEDGPSLPSELSHKVITRESLIAAQSEDLRRVAEMFGMTQQHARTLLIHHRWDVERLFGRLAEKGKEQLFLEAGLPVETSFGSRNKILQKSAITCGVCYEEVFQDLTSTMYCNHSFCNECWTEHFLVKIKDGQSRRIKCMQTDCNAVCDEGIIRDLVYAKDQEAGKKFDRFLLESYIEDNSKVKWCPSIPHCGNAIQVEGDPYCEIECICGQQFCFNCAGEAHSPCSCLMWQLWEKKCKDESETVNWLTAHTKPCPTCYKPVEKNGGCNLVGCICGQAFCWLCGGATGRKHTWNSIEGHSCGRYKQDRDTEAARAERDLTRYIHYHSRWKGHTDSLKLEAKQREVVQNRISKLEASESQVKDYSWLTNGLQRLFRARKALSYSYAFAFSMFGNSLFKDEIEPSENEILQNLFEDQQQQLEMTIERLSKVIEKPFELNVISAVSEIRLQVINLSTLTDNLCRKMYECIENDLLGRLELTTHHIAKYSSKGADKASEIVQNQEPNTTRYAVAATVIKPVTPKEGKDEISGHCSDQISNIQGNYMKSRGSLYPAESSITNYKRPRRDIDLNIPVDDIAIRSFEWGV